MRLWDIFGKFPGTDYESFNYDWVIGKLKELKDSVAAALASEQAAAESAEHAAGSMGLAMIYQNKAKDYRDEARGFANDAEDSAESIAGVVNQVESNTSRIDNLIATAGDGTVPSELTDIRVGWDGVTYDTAGSAVREQITRIMDWEKKTDNTPVYYPSITWEDGSLGNTGEETATSDRIRTEHIPVIYGRKLMLQHPLSCALYIYPFDEKGVYHSGSGIGWLSAAGATGGVREITLPDYTATIRIIVRPNTGTLSLATDSLHDSINVWYTLGDNYDKTVNNIPTAAGTLEDYTNNVHVIGYETTRIHSRDFIPVPNNCRHMVLHTPTDTEGYVFEYDEDFQFIKERGWTRPEWYQYLSNNTKYVKFMLKNGDGSEISPADVTCSATFYDELNNFNINPRMLDTQLIAHRGCDTLAPENTLPSIELACQKGFNIVEVDLGWTSDNVCVLLHDTTIDRTSDGTGTLHDMTYSQVSQYDFGSWFGPAFTGTKIPTLKEALLLAKKYNVTLQLDIASTSKTYINTACLNAMIADILETGMMGSVTVAAYYQRARETMALYPGICITLGLQNQNTANNQIELTHGCRMMAGSIEISLSNSALRKICHDNNVKYQVWAINSQASANSQFNAGTDWIITDSLEP